MNMCNESLVSIIVPVYNIVSYVKDCVESIQRQTYRNIEIIVVDDGSVDGSGEFCEEAAQNDTRVKVIRQENAGVVAARGVGIESAAGEYMMFVDGDDWIEANMVEDLVRQLNGADLITSGVYYQESAERTIERYDEFPEGRYSDQELINGIFTSMIYDAQTESVQRLTPWSCNKLYRSDLVKELYGEVALDITFAEDSVFLYKYLLRCHSIVVKHHCYYHYRYRKDSVMHAVKNNMLMDINKVYLALEEDFRAHELKASLLFQLQRWIIVMCCRAINSHMGFEKQAYIPQYMADISCVADKRFVLYGAGQVGQDTYRQLRKLGYQAVLWADKNYKLHQKEGLPVVPPDEIANCKYDVIFIAVNEQKVAEKIKKELSEKGIPYDVQVWRKPVHIW